jgi:hypothetical protein
MFSVRCWRLNVAVFATAASALAEVHYVDVNSTNATPPYTNWTIAATNIQDAVDAAVAGDEIVVTNGIYATGGRAGNRVVVDKPASLRSINGPQVTIIRGLKGFININGSTNGVIRCVYLTNGASLSGFTVRSGGANTGGGVFAAATAVVSNCVVASNGALSGGGAVGGTLNNCALTGNSSWYGGGGARDCVLNNCTLTGNSTHNNGPDFAIGGGAFICTLNNCTLSGNSADSGNAAYSSTLINCIVLDGSENSSLGNCWTESDPLFVDEASGNLRLQSNSPCINAGNNSYVTSATDLDGNPRLVGGAVDIGAYEFQSLDLIGFGVVSNQFGFNVTGQSNWVIVLEASSDFANWIPLTTNTLGGSPFPFSDPTPPNLPQRFYRARMQ